MFINCCEDWCNIYWFNLCRFHLFANFDQRRDCSYKSWMSFFFLNNVAREKVGGAMAIECSSKTADRNGLVAPSQSVHSAEDR